MSSSASMDFVDGNRFQIVSFLKFGHSFCRINFVGVLFGYPKRKENGIKCLETCMENTKQVSKQLILFSFFLVLEVVSRVGLPVNPIAGS